MSEDFSEGLRTRRMVLEPRASELPVLDTADIGLRVPGRTRWNRKAFRCRMGVAALAKVGGERFRGSEGRWRAVSGFSHGGGVSPCPLPREVPGNFPPGRHDHAWNRAGHIYDRALSFGLRL